MSVYQFEERPASVILGRRGLFKVVGLCAVAAGATGWAVGDLLANRNSVLLARQKGLYADDKLCQAMNRQARTRTPSCVRSTLISAPLRWTTPCTVCCTRTTSSARSFPLTTN